MRILKSAIIGLAAVVLILILVTDWLSEPGSIIIKLMSIENLLIWIYIGAYFLKKK